MYHPQTVYFASSHMFFTEIKPLGDNSGVLTKGRNYQIVARLQEDNAALFGPRPLYDGGSLLYSKRYIEGQTVCAVVALPLASVISSYCEYQIDVCMNRRTNRPSHSVSITRVATIDLRYGVVACNG